MRKRDFDAGSGLKKFIFVALLIVVGLYFALLDITAPKIQKWIGEHRTEKWAPEANYALGASCFYVGNSSLAIDIYRVALARFPGHRDAAKARYRIAQSLERQKKFREAIRSYQVFREQYPKSKYAEVAKDRIDSLGYLVRMEERRRGRR